MNRKKHIVFGLVLLAVVAMVFAGVWAGGEAYFRHRYGRLDSDQAAAARSKSFFTYSPTLGWRGRSGVSMRHNSGAWVTHNAQGFRDTPWDLDTPRPRVLLLGDSNLWGFGVNDDEYPAFFLNRDHPEVRWFNAGMNGYGTDQQLLVFRELQPRLRPDLTVLVVCGNDRGENTSRRVRGYNKPYFEWNGQTLELRNSPVPEPAPSDAIWVSAPDEIFQKTGSYILYHLAQVFEAGQNRARQDPAGLAKEVAGSSALDPTEALIRQLFRETGGRLAVVLINPDASLVALGEQERIPILDMSPTPVTQPGPHTYPPGAPKYGHWTPEGNRRAAQLIAGIALPQLAKAGLYPTFEVAAPHVCIINQSDHDLMEIRWIDSNGKDWGDQIFKSDSLLSGKTAAVLLPPDMPAGDLAIRASDPDGRELSWPPRPIRPGETIVLLPPPGP